MTWTKTNSSNSPYKNFGYNIQNGLANYKSALANYGTQIVKVNCVGDSVTRGQFSSNEVNNSWVGQLRTMLQNRYGVCGEGYINTYEANTSVYGTGSITRWTAGTGWATNSSPYAERYINSSGATSSSTVTFTGVSVDLLYIKISGGGSANILIDGTQVGTINCSNASTDYTGLVTYGGLTNASHTLTITPTGNGNVLIQGIIARTDTKGIQVNRIAVSGSKASDWNTSNALKIWQQSKPHLTTLAYGLNEAGGGLSNVSSYSTNLEALITYFQGLGSDVLLIPYYRPADSWSTVWDEYVNVNFSLADKHNCGLVNIFQSWMQDYDIAQGLGLFGTTTDYQGTSGTNAAHPSDKGYKLIAHTLVPHLIL